MYYKIDENGQYSHNVVAVYFLDWYRSMNIDWNYKCFSFRRSWSSRSVRFYSYQVIIIIVIIF